MTTALIKLDRVLLSTMQRFNKDLEWLKLNHPSSYKRINKLNKHVEKEYENRKATRTHKKVKRTSKNG